MMKVRKVIASMFALCFMQAFLYTYAAEPNEILSAWEEEGSVSVRVRCGTAETANIFYVGYAENGQFVGVDILRATPGEEATYVTNSIAGAKQGKILLLSADMRVLAPAKEVGEKPEAPAPAAGPDTLTVAGTAYTLGMTEHGLLEAAGEPVETLATVAGYQWFVYGTETYEDFFMAGVYQNQVVALCSGGPAFSWEGVQAGAVGVNDSSGYATLYTDKNDGYILHALMLTDRAALPQARDNSSEALWGESRANFHMTNAFRRYHGLSILQWSEAAAEAARLHSQDMADQNYFSHDSLDGRDFAQRMEAQGIRWRWSAAENISAGRSSGVAAYDGWVNSSGHRSNMLSAKTYLGVGSGYSASSTYKYYATQDYYS